MDDDRIILDWRVPAHLWADRWSYNLALYAILNPSDNEFLYLGKVDSANSTVRSRSTADDKHERVWRRIEQDRGFYKHRIIIGEFRLPNGQLLTRELMCDVESSLINEIKPWANTMNIRSRGFRRIGMVICCRGHSPLKRRTFRNQ